MSETTATAPFDHANDDVVRDLMMTIVDDMFHVLDDSDEPAFGSYARYEQNGNVLVVRHETDDSPAVRITVERIA